MCLNRELAVAGFYISCSMDLQNRLSWVKDKSTADRFADDIIHYFNLLATREVLITLTLIERRVDRELYWGLGHKSQKTIHEFVIRMIDCGSVPRLQGVTLLEQALDVVESSLFQSQKNIASRRPTSPATSPSFLGDLSSVLAEELPIFRRKRIAFLIDDFSEHRISERVQIVLNRVIWERRDSHIFKVSSEKYGATLADDLSATAEQPREMVEIDCGTEFLALNDIPKQNDAAKFATELLDNRLTEAGYEGRVEEIIGHSSWPETTLALALRGRGARRSGMTNTTGSNAFRNFALGTWQPSCLCIAAYLPMDASTRRPEVKYRHPSNTLRFGLSVKRCCNLFGHSIRAGPRCTRY